VFFWGSATGTTPRRSGGRRALHPLLSAHQLRLRSRSHDPNHDTTERILPGAWETLARELAEHPPLFFVDTDPGTVAKKYPPAKYPYLRRLLVEEYREVFATPEGVVYRRIDERGSAG
jgi:hypothetical protein